MIVFKRLSIPSLKTGVKSNYLKPVSGSIGYESKSRTVYGIM